MNLGSFGMLFIILVLIVTFFTIQQKDGFQVHIPETIAQKNLVEGSSEDYAPSYILASGPAPGAVASFNSLPYIDPSQERAKYQRILNVQTTLQGFLDNEAATIQEMSDPAIQLPLTNARSDLTKLKNEILVLKRNPGIDSMISQEELDGIQANLAYLQNKWRMSVYNDVELEGFVDASGASTTDASGASTTDASGSTTDASGSTTDASGSRTDASGSRTDASGSKTDASGSKTDASGSKTDASGSNASLRNLDELVTKIDSTIARFTLYDVTDPITLARVNILKQYKNKIQDVVKEVISGARKESEIPITKADYDSFLKTFSDVKSPISKLFGNNVSLADLFPAYSAGDVSGASLAQYLFNKYSDTIMKGLSFDVNINYASEAEQGIANRLASTLADNYNTPTTTQLGYNYNSHQPYEKLYNATNSLSNVSNGQFSDVVNNLQKRYFGSNNGPQVPKETNEAEKSTNRKVDNIKTQQSNASTTGQLFNWHERANFICDSIEKRGLNPDDFACLHPDQYVSEDFSWRGYAKMVCGRLGTSYDTSLPEVCGCPPATWIGWKP